MLIVTRNFDSRSGSAVALVGVVVAWLTVKLEVDPLLAVGVALAVGLALGRLERLVGHPRGRAVVHRHAGGHALSSGASR